MVGKTLPKKKPGKFNFRKFIKKLTDKRNLIRVYYYNCPLDREKNETAYIAQQKFFEKLRKIPDFKVILCRMQKDEVDGKAIYHAKEDDIHLAVDMVKLAYNDAYDTAILVSSDGDFVPAVNTIQEIGKKVENIGFEVTFSYHLKQECDKFKKLDKKEVSKFF